MTDMTKPYDGGPAFPIETTATPWAEGMTLRDWFAGQALTGLLVTGPNDEHFLHSAGPKSAAGWAYSFADAMLEARGK